ncbi:MAG: GIY-YIG nuclease family protein [Burkholderiaceae bacterium]|nr:GIY-YIG nuclease family protein [Burkholderiaceae bacterium]
MPKSILGKHFVYILPREDGFCFKVGLTSGLTRRLRRLHQENGPFCNENSLVLRTDSRLEARRFEEAMRTIYNGYRIKIPIAKRRNGETEWYLMAAYHDVVSTIHELAVRCYGNANGIQRIPIHEIAPLSAAHLPRLQKFAKKLHAIEPQTEAKLENTTSLQAFRNIVIQIMSNLLGIAKISTPDNVEAYLFEIFLRPGSLTKQDVGNIIGTPALIAENREFCASARLFTSWESTRFFIRGSIQMPPMCDEFEGTWESQGYIEKYRSILNDLAEKFPVPVDLEKFVGHLDLL